jgi:RNA polymerase sigma factor (sigma-70 family)
MEADQALLERWRAGEQAAGRDLLARYFAQLHRFFSNKCNEPDELIQDTFLALVKARDQFAGRSSFRTYLFTIARHTLYAHLRVVQREQAFDPEVSSIAQLVTTPASRLARSEELGRLCAALRTLPIEQQTLLELHYWEDLDAPALGEIFELPAGAMRTRLSRARQALRDALAAARAAPPEALVSVEMLDTWAHAAGLPPGPGAR